MEKNKKRNVTICCDAHCQELITSTLVIEVGVKTATVAVRAKSGIALKNITSTLRMLII